MTANRSRSRNARLVKTRARLLATFRDSDPGSDEALEALRQALDPSVRCPRLEHAQAAVVETWAGILASDAVKGIGHPDYGDVLGDARLWLLEQLLTFQPAADGGNVGAFIRTRQTWFRSNIRRDKGGHTRTHGQFAVMGAVGAVREQYVARTHHEPSEDALRQAVLELIQSQAREKILEKPDGSGQNISEDELQEAVRRRLSKDGVFAALEDLNFLRAASQGELHLDTTGASDEEGGDGVRLPALPDIDIDAEDPEVVYESLLMVALGDHQWARAAFSAKAGPSPSGAEGDPDSTSLKDLAGAVGQLGGELKRVVTRGRARVYSPHAHYAHLSAVVVERD